MSFVDSNPKRVMIVPEQVRERLYEILHILDSAPEQERLDSLQSIIMHLFLSTFENAAEVFEASAPLFVDSLREIELMADKAMQTGEIDVNLLPN